MSFHEFHEPIEVELAIGKGRAILIERTPHDYWWTVLMDTGAVVTVAQNKVRTTRSYSHQRGIGDEEMKKIIQRPRRGGQQ
jgi:hypothetical protein